MSKPQWILVASASQARLFQQQEANGPVTAVGSFMHARSRLRSSKLGDDKPGREPGPRSFGGAAFEPRIDAQRKEHLRFAQELADLLEAAGRKGNYASVRLFASSPFLGELEQVLGRSTQRLLVGAHDVDLTRVGLAEMGARIRDELAAAR